MLEGIKLTLSHLIKGSLVLASAPEGLNDLEYTITRSDKFYGAIFQFSGDLGFTNDGKNYIDDILDTYGITAKVTLLYEIKNPETLIYETFVSGLLNLSKNSREQNYTYVSFENTDFKTKLNNRSGTKVPYNRQYSIENVALSGITYDYINLLCQGVSANTVTRAIFLYELFYSIIQQITDSDYNVLQSNLFGRTELKDASTNEYYVSNGEFYDKFITKGVYIRGWDENDSEISISLDDIFEEINKIIPIGLGFSIDQYGREIVVIEKRETFFENRCVLELDDNSLSDLKKTVADEFLFSEYELGSSKSSKTEIPYGLTEYQTKVEYSAPISIVNKKLSLVTQLRTDGVGINDIITNYLKTGSTDVKQTDYDESLFLIDSMTSAGTYGGKSYTWKNKKGENFTIDLRANDPGLNYNLDLSAARTLIQRYGKWINIGLDQVAGLLKFNKAENLTTLRTLKTGDTDYIEDFADIDISILETPIMTGNKFSFNYPINVSEIKTLQSGFYGQIQFWNNNEIKTSSGWISEISTKPTDKQTNMELYECVTVAELLGFMLMEDGAFMLAEDGSFMLME
jgi:hypothetical protein